MDLLHEPPPGFDGIAKVFAMARHLPSSHQLDLKVGLARDGVLFALGRLDGHRQLNFFTEHLRQLGWREHLLGGDDEMHGCDLLFSLPEAAAAADEDPSFIRRTPVELWGAEGEHAEL